MVGWRVREIEFDRWMTTPGISPDWTGLRSAGTVMWIFGLGRSVRPCLSAADQWLSVAPEPARANAAQILSSGAGSPEKGAYTPRWSRCQRPERTRLSALDAVSRELGNCARMMTPEYSECMLPP